MSEGARVLVQVARQRLEEALMLPDDVNIVTGRWDQETECLTLTIEWPGGNEYGSGEHLEYRKLVWDARLGTRIE